MATSFQPHVPATTDENARSFIRPFVLKGLEGARSHPAAEYRPNRRADLFAVMVFRPGPCLSAPAPVHLCRRLPHLSHCHLRACNQIEIMHDSETRSRTC